MSQSKTSRASSGRTVEDAAAVEASPTSPAAADIPAPALVERVPTTSAPIVIPMLRRTYFARIWGIAGAVLAVIDLALLAWWWSL